MQPARRHPRELGRMSVCRTCADTHHRHQDGLLEPERVVVRSAVYITLSGGNGIAADVAPAVSSAWLEESDFVSFVYITKFSATAARRVGDCHGGHTLTDATIAALDASAALLWRRSPHLVASCSYSASRIPLSS